MKKKFLISLGVATMASSVVLASPMNDYSKGNLNIDINMSISPEGVYSFTTDEGKNRVGLDISYGLGKDWAIQAKYNQFSVDNYYEKQNFLNLNTLYRINNNIFAFVGYDHTKVDIGYNRTNIDGIHAGLLGKAQLTNKLTGWASITTGSKSHGHEVGLGYEIQNNVDFNLIYGETTYKKVDFGFNGPFMEKHKIKGINAGFTFKL